MAQACAGRCAVFLVAALALDAVGLALVVAGAAGHPELDGRSYGDFLVWTGALLLFLSLLCWLFWYSGNLRGVPDEELPIGARPSPSAPRRRASLLRLAAKLSERLSQSRNRRHWPAPSLPAPARDAPGAAVVTISFRPAGPFELGRLHPAAHPEQTGMTTEERLV